MSDVHIARLRVRAGPEDAALARSLAEQAGRLLAQGLARGEQPPAPGHRGGPVRVAMRPGEPADALAARIAQQILEQLG